MEYFESFDDGKAAKEIEEFLNAYFELQAQINNPTKDGMIKALLDAKNVASQEITMLEQRQGEIYPTSGENFEFWDLYRKLSQYQQGLRIHAVNKFGEETVKNAIEKRCSSRQ